MIQVAIMAVIMALIPFLFSLLPEAINISTTLGSAIGTFAGYAYQFNDIFPIDTLWTVLLYTLYFQGGILLWKLANWLYNKLFNVNRI